MCRGGVFDMLRAEFWLQRKSRRSGRLLQIPGVVKAALVFPVRYTAETYQSSTGLLVHTLTLRYTSYCHQGQPG